MVGGEGGHPQGIASACAYLKSKETGEVRENLQVYLGKNYGCAENLGGMASFGGMYRLGREPVFPVGQRSHQR